MARISKPVPPSSFSDTTASRPTRNRNPSAKAAATAAATPRPRRKPVKKATPASAPNALPARRHPHSPDPPTESNGDDSDRDAHYVPSDADTTTNMGADPTEDHKEDDDEDEDMEDGEDEYSYNDDKEEEAYVAATQRAKKEAYIAAQRVKEDQDRRKHALTKVTQVKAYAPKPLIASTTARGPPRTPSTFIAEKTDTVKTPLPPVAPVAGKNKRTNAVIDSNNEPTSSSEKKRKIVLEFGPKPAKATVKLEKKLAKHLLPSTPTIAISDDDNDEPIVIPTPTPAAASITDQSYWRKARPEEWPALNHAIIIYKIHLVTNNAFADNETLRDYALKALQETFEIYDQFEIAHGMVEMIMSSTYSYRGNFKANSAKTTPTLYQFDSENPEATKERAKLALKDRNYRFFAFGLPPDDSSRTRNGFCDHPSLPVILGPIFAGRKKIFWESPEGQAIITTKIEPQMENLCAFGLTVTHAMIDEWVSGVRIKAEMTSEKYGKIFQEHLTTIKAYKVDSPYDWEVVSKSILETIMRQQDLVKSDDVTPGVSAASLAFV